MVLINGLSIYLSLHSHIRVFHDLPDEYLQHSPFLLSVLQFCRLPPFLLPLVVLSLSLNLFSSFPGSDVNDTLNYKNFRKLEFRKY